MDEIILGIVLGLVSSFFFAIQNIVVKWYREEMKPIAANTIRIWTSLGIMAIFLFNPFRSVEINVPIESLVVLAFSVCTGAVFGDIIYFTSQNRIGVSAAFAIANTYPVITYIITIFFLGEIFLPVRLIGAVLAAIGIAGIARGQVLDEINSVEERNHDILGFGLAGLTCLMYAITTLLLQIGAAGIDPVDANFIRMLFGSIILTPLLCASHKQGTPVPPKNAIKLMSVVGGIGMAFASLLYIVSIQFIGASLAAVIGATSPLFALPFSIVILKEPFNWKVGLGTVITIMGVWLAVI